MTEIRKSIERQFENLGRFIFRRRFLVILATAIWVGALASQLPKLTMDTSNEGFLHEKDPVLRTYDTFRDLFGRDEMILVAVRSDNIFTRNFLLKLKALHEDLEREVPYLDDVTSLINARDIRGEGEEFIVEDLLEDWPTKPKDLSRVRERAISNPMYRNMLIGEDGEFTAILVKTTAFSGEGGPNAAFDGDVFETDTAKSKYLTPEENSETLKAIGKVVARYNGPDFPVFVAGSPVFTDVLKKIMKRDVPRFVGMCVLVIAALLAIMFRRPAGVVLPLVTVIVSLVSTLGLMGLVGVAVKLPTQILPSFILAVGVGDSVHILAIYYKRLRIGCGKEEALAFTLGHSGLAVLLTSLTTAGGLLSFLGAELAPISDLGLFSAAGVLMAMFFSLFFLPAMLAVLPAGSPGTDASLNASEHSRLERFLSAVGDFSTGHPRKILAVSACIAAVGLAGAFRLRFSHNILKWIPETVKARRDTEIIDRELRGSISLELLVDTGAENGLYDPAIMKKLDSLAREVEGIADGDLFVGKAQSAADILKEINQALNGNRREFYAVPEDRRLIAQEFLLFENSGSDDVEDFVDSLFSMARFTVKTPMIDAVSYAEFMKKVEGLFRDAFGAEVSVTTTGMMAILGRVISAVKSSMTRSYIIAFIVITTLMILLIGDLRMGLASMIPNLFPIVVCLGFMGWFDIPLDNFTMLVGAIAIGLAVDDTIHFMHGFRRYNSETGDPREAVRRTLETSGRAMLFTSLVLSAGFLVYTFATLSNMILFGLLTGMAIVIALLADFLIAPALVVLMSGAKMRTADEKSP